MIAAVSLQDWLARISHVMPYRMSKTDRESAIAALRSRLETARQSAARVLADLAAGFEAEEIRQVYHSHMARLEDRICELEAHNNPDRSR